MKIHLVTLAAALSLAIFLGGCLGGNGGSSSSATNTATATTVTSTLSFPLLKALQTNAVNGSTQTFTISGGCTATGKVVSAPATTLTTFEGVGAISNVGTVTWTMTVCTPSTLADTTTYYSDANYIPIGYDDTAGGGDYAVYLTTPTVPTSVKVGDTGTIGTRTLYSSSAKTISTGTVVLSYIVEADTASTAIINLIAVKKNSSNVVTSTIQSRTRINSAGGSTLLSDDVQQANGSTLHYVVTYDAPTVTTNAAAAPVAKVTSISGSPLYVGTTLTGSYIYADANLDPEATSTYQWFRNSVAITGANGLTYTLVAADLNSTIAFQITPVALSGSPLTGTAASAHLTTQIYAGIQRGGLSWSNFTTNLYNWSAANTFCTTSTINGVTGWRLPTSNELNSNITSSLSGVSTSTYYWSSTIGATSGKHSALWLIYSGPTDIADTTSAYAVCVQ